jgi:hypothetical protein
MLSYGVNHDDNTAHLDKKRKFFCNAALFEYTVVKWLYRNGSAEEGLQGKVIASASRDEKDRQ